MPTFADRLQQKIREHSPLCVGIDPSAALLKSCGLPDSAEGALDFGRRVLEAADFRIGVLKPQSAFFERFGSSGFHALEELVRFARAREVLVLLDGKRGDIDTTAAAYAEGYFSATTTLRVDAITTHCYLGLAALEPFFAAAIAARRRRVRRGALIQPRRPGVADCAPCERRDRRAEPVPRDHCAQFAAATGGPRSDRRRGRRDLRGRGCHRRSAAATPSYSHPVWVRRARRCGMCWRACPPLAVACCRTFRERFSRTAASARDPHDDRPLQDQARALL